MILVVPLDLKYSSWSSYWRWLVEITRIHQVLLGSFPSHISLWNCSSEIETLSSAETPALQLGAENWITLFLKKDAVSTYILTSSVKHEPGSFQRLQGISIKHSHIDILSQVPDVGITFISDKKDKANKLQKDAMYKYFHLSKVYLNKVQK